METGLARRLIAAGFGVILMMLLLVLALWIHDTRENVEQIEHLVEEHEESIFLSTMRDTAVQRAIALHRMALMEDPFDQDEAYMHFRGLAQDFLLARDGLLEEIELGHDQAATDHDKQEIQIWAQSRTLMSKGGQLQNQIAMQILDGNLNEANQMLVRDLPVVQKDVLSSLGIMYELNRERIVDQLQATSEQQYSTYRLIALLGAVVVIFALFMAWVLKRNSRVEKSFARHGRRVRMLYELASAPGMSFREKIVRILETGCMFLDMEVGLVSRQEEDTDNGILLFSASTAKDLEIVDGEAFPLADCPSIKDQWRDSEVIEFLSLEEGLGSGSLAAVRSGIMIPVLVNGRSFGSVGFCSRTPRTSRFSKDEKDLADLIATWISMTLEKLFRERELEEARIHSEAASRTKSGFLANMSHELRTPLNAIIGYSEMLEESTQETLDQEGLDDLRRINASGKHLLSLINDILDISKIEAGKIELDLQDVNIGSVIHDVNSLIEPLMEKSANRFSLEWNGEDLHLYCDEVRLRQILLNLLGNAAKFCHGGNVILRVFMDNEKGFQRLIFEVSDTGIGIEANKLSSLFKPFSQAENKLAGQYGGTGLGLAISRRLAILMEGNIEVFSRRNEGSTFRLWLPVYTKQQKEHGELMQQAQQV